MLKKTTVLAVAHMLLLLAANAQAQTPVPVSYTPEQLIYAQKSVRIDVPENIYQYVLGKVEVEVDANLMSGSSGSTESCKLRFGAEKENKKSIKVFMNKCAPIVKNCMPVDWTYMVMIDSFPLKLNFKSIIKEGNLTPEDIPAIEDSNTKSLEVAKKDLIKESALVTRAAICSLEKGWSKLSVTSQNLQIAADQVPKDRSFYVWAELDSEPWIYRLVHLKSVGQNNVVNNQNDGGDASLFEDCADPQGRQRDVICVDAYNSRTNKTKSPEVSWSRKSSSHILRPNTAVLVRVRHPYRTQVRFAMEGQRGLVTHGIQDNTRSAASDGSRSAASNDPSPAAMVSSHSYAPRKPGSADIRVQILDENGVALTGEELIEMTVEETYAAAFRVGLAAVGGEAVDRSYEARRGTSGMSELAVKSRSAVEPELVVGFAPFVIEAFRGGRAYSFADGFASKWLRFAPYIGVGVLTQSPNGIDGLKSFYFGLEWELAPSFSVAFTGVLRRVTRPADGLDVGSIVAEGAELTQSTHTLGWGVVVNIAPGFLRIANQTAASFFK